LRLIVKPGPTVPTTVFGAADAVPASRSERATTATAAPTPKMRDMGSSLIEMTLFTCLSFE